MNIELSESTLPKRIGAYLQEKAPKRKSVSNEKTIRAVCFYAETHDSVEAALDHYFNLERQDNEVYREEIQNFFCSLCQQGLYPEITYFDNEDYEVYQVNDAFEKYFDQYATQFGDKPLKLRNGLELLQEEKQIYVKRESKVALITWVDKAQNISLDCSFEVQCKEDWMVSINRLEKQIKVKPARQIDAC